MCELIDAIDQLQPRRVMVLGDLILDRYTWGAAERVSPEAPTVVLRVDRVDVRLGGAAAVADLLHGLGAEVLLAGVVGDDQAGRTMRQLLAECGIASNLVLVDGHRTTTIKERFLGRAPHRTSHQILRVDHETTRELDATLASELSERLADSLVGCAALVVSDYAKGTCGASIVARAISAARRVGIPVIVDPARNVDLARYRGAAVIKPNRHEAEIAADMSIRTISDAVSAAQALKRNLPGSAVVVTLDRDGIALLAANGVAEHFPTPEVQVADITGAGDTVAAIISLAIANEVPLEQAVPLANLAAGRQIRSTGIVPITLDELRADALLQTHPTKFLDLARLGRIVEQHRQRGRRIVLTNGCFDLLHVGHITYLEAAARLGDVLVVAINSDESVRAIKGQSRPLIGERDRARMLAALTCVDHVVIFTEPTPHSVLRALRPDVLVKGGDYSALQVVGRDIVEGYGGEVRVVDYVPGVSTSQLLDRLSALGAGDPNP